MCAEEPALARVVSIAREDFYSRYYAANRPVLLPGFVRDWPARRRWSPRYLAGAFGHVEVEVMTGVGCDRHYQARQRMRLGALVDLIERDPGSGDVYLVAQNQALQQPALAGLWEDLTFDSGLLDPRPAAERVSLWFGPCNTVTPLHYDLQNALLVQTFGRKRVTLFSPQATPLLYNVKGGYSSVDPEHPDLERFPRFAMATPCNVVLEPGDALFIPVRWWHQVRSLSVSISLSISNFVWLNPTEDPASKPGSDAARGGLP